MAEYTIRDLERLSGVKAHTIRIWEQRYGLLKPKRTDTNIRRYDDEELKLLLNVSDMLKYGGKISKLSAMEPAEIARQLDSVIPAITDKNEYCAAHVTKLILAMVELDEALFEKVLGHTTIKYGFQCTMVNLILPFLTRVGIMWQTGEINVAQEHFISNMVRQKLIVAIDGLSIPPRDAERYILFLPNAELHELGLLFAKYILKEKGKNVLYLGQSVPLEDLFGATETYKPHNLFTFITSPDSKDNIKDYIDSLHKRFPDYKIFIAGSQINYHQFEDFKNITFLRTVQDLQKYIE